LINSLFNNEATREPAQLTLKS